MLDAMTFNVDEDGNSCFLVSLGDFGIKVQLMVEVAHPMMTEWDTSTMDAFKNDCNRLFEHMHIDFHRLAGSVSRNAQLALMGLPEEYYTSLDEYLDSDGGARTDIGD